MFWSAVDDRVLEDRILRFPQRVPRAGFFDELIASESPEVADSLTRRRAELAARAARGDLSLSPRLCANVLALAARYGAVDAAPASGQIDIESEDGFRAAQAAAVVRISRSVSSGRAVELAELARLCERALRRPGLSPELRANALNRYVVTSARHKACAQDSALRAEAAAALGAYLSSDVPETFDARLAASVLWRGLAMADGLDERRRGEALARALRLAEEAEPGDEAQRVLRDENLVTLLQTLAKWRGRSSTEEGLACLERMRGIDPEDSTASSEIGLLEMKRQDWRRALDCFRSAAALGPPGLAMNLFFQGEAAAKLGLAEEAERSWRRAAEVDPAGLSPRLSLRRLFLERGDESEAGRLREELLGRPELRDQLTREERDELEGR